jgi:hypothetical protein
LAEIGEDKNITRIEGDNVLYKNIGHTLSAVEHAREAREREGALSRFP